MKGRARHCQWQAAAMTAAAYRGLGAPEAAGLAGSLSLKFQATGQFQRTRKRTRTNLRTGAWKCNWQLVLRLVTEKRNVGRFENCSPPVSESASGLVGRS